MYHIWAVQCQIQLRRGEESDHHGRPARKPAPCRVELTGSFGRSLDGMHQGDGLLGCQGLLGFDKPGGDQSGLAGHRQGIKDGLFEEPLGTRDKVEGEANLPFVTPGKGFALDRLTQGVPCAR